MPSHDPIYEHLVHVDSSKLFAREGDGAQEANEETAGPAGKRNIDAVSEPLLSLPPNRFDLNQRRIGPRIQSSFLRSGAKYHGTQQSGRSIYDVSVKLQYVDIEQSFLCGFLKIQGLTEDNPSLTTYFEGDIVGPKNSFLTKRPDWGSSEKVDMQHWARFGAFKPIAKQVKRGQYTLDSVLDHDHIFMRWKELYIIKDESSQDEGILTNGSFSTSMEQRTALDGVSYAGFYYICYEQRTGHIQGLYYHKNSEMFQQLSLQHEPSVHFPQFEFR